MLDPGQLGWFISLLNKSQQKRGVLRNKAEDKQHNIVKPSSLDLPLAIFNDQINQAATTHSDIFAIVVVATFHR